MVRVHPGPPSSTFFQMEKEFTGQHEQDNRIPIHVDDLVTLSIPRRKRLSDLVVFRVIKDRDRFMILFHSGAMSDGDPNYKQNLRHQVYRVVGNIESGIDENLLD